MISLGILESGKCGSIAMSIEFESPKVITYSAMTKFHIEFVPTPESDQEDKEHRATEVAYKSDSVTSQMDSHVSKPSAKSLSLYSTKPSLSSFGPRAVMIR